MVVIARRLPRRVNAEIRRTLGLPAPGKYGNEVVKLDGYTFQSLKERDRYLVLLMRQKTKLITDLKVHPRFEFQVNGKKIGSYTADFSYLEISGTGLDKEAELVVEDVKSQPTMTRTYRRNKKLMLAIYEIEVREIV